MASVLPDLIDRDPSYFNISQLKMLSAGDWFIQVSSVNGTIILHDSTLWRTINVASVLPDLIDRAPSYFNISQLKMLSAVK